MHPSYSVILFTTASGAGYGLLFLLAVLGATGQIAIERWFGVVGFGLALGLITIGLLASTFHLGHAERAWRALSQWRSSWLSREGVMAIATYVPAGLLAAAWVFLENVDGIWALVAGCTALFALVTVYCTGQIYATLRTIRQWYQPSVPWAYLALALATGALLLNLLAHGFGMAAAWMTWATVLLLGLALVLKLVYWRAIDRSPTPYTVGAATGLGHLGPVRPLEPPHTQANFVMREMGFKVARKHAGRLRVLAILFGFIIPIFASLLTIFSGELIGIAAAAIAVASCALGIVIERWLFFAEAEHVVTLYYGAQAA